MAYARLENNTVVEYPVSEFTIRSRFPNTSFNQDFTPPAGYVLVNDVLQPSVTYLQDVNEGAPEENAGAWFRTWIVTDASQEEINFRTQDQSQLIRNQRNQKLADCDWTQLPDAPVDHTTWATYRQQLRDISSQPGFPWNVVWPQPPQ